MKATTSMRIGVTTFVAVLTIAVQPSAQSQTLVQFDAPNSIATSAASINPAGAMTGYYYDASYVFHGFLLGANGSFTTLDAPGAGIGGGLGTFAAGINSGGEVAGYYIDTNNVVHGSLRDAKGKFTSFDAPGAGTLPPQGVEQGTAAFSINNSGVSTGYYTDSAYVNHGFVRAANGVITTFDAKDAQNYPSGDFNCGTLAMSISNTGEITGYFVDNKTYRYRGFVRSAKGVIVEFDAPESGDGTAPLAINQLGEITGLSSDANGVFHAFLRSAAGALISFDAPQAGTSPGQGTAAYAISPNGDIAGYYIDANYVYHGFLRTADGTVTSFSAPDGGNDVYQGTIPLGINPAGKITGYYSDQAYTSHGFVWTPPSK